MNYKEALQWLFSTNRKEKIKLGLQRMQRVLPLLGHPERQFKAIHIAGTNDKGSVSTKVASGLPSVGLFTSPHISTFRERIQINGKPIEEEEVVYHLEQILKVESTLTFFEATTLLAFLHFAHKKVQYAVIETGLGGRLDATNCIIPEISVITSIAEDHTEILGKTIEAIALEKAGIIKPNVPVIIGPNVPLEVIQSVAPSPIQIQGVFNIFDEENSAIAQVVSEHLKISNSTLQNAICRRPPCRIEEVVSSPYPIILDVAHNPNGLEALFKSLSFLYPRLSFAAIVGLSSSKDIEGCLKVLIQHTSHLYLVQASHRGTPLSQLINLLEGLSFSHYTPCSSICEALTLNQGPLVIAGTFFIMDEARKALGLHYPYDPIELNESFM